MLTLMRECCIGPREQADGGARQVSGRSFVYEVYCSGEDVLTCGSLWQPEPVVIQSTADELLK